MKYRPLPQCPEIRLSEFGLGLWSFASDMWPRVGRKDAVRLIREAADLGVNYLQAGDAYTMDGVPGAAEEMARDVFNEIPRDRLIVATTAGHDIYDAPRHPVTGYPHFTDILPEKEWGAYLRRACEGSLRRLAVETIDIYQLHNARSMEAFRSSEIRAAMEGLVKDGKIRTWGLALGPANGWRDEGAEGLARYRPSSLMVIFSLFEPYPGEIFYQVARATGTGVTARVSLASGQLAGTYRPGMKFPDHRAYRTKMDTRWIEKGLRRAESLSFLLEPGRTLAQAALRYSLDRFPDVSVSSVPTLYADEGVDLSAKIREFAALSDVPALTREELGRIEALRAYRFGVPEPDMILKGNPGAETEWMKAAHPWVAASWKERGE